MNLQEFPNIKPYYDLSAQNDHLIAIMLIVIFASLLWLGLAKVTGQQLLLKAFGVLIVIAFYSSLFVLALRMQS